MSYIERDVTLNIDGKTAKFDDMVYIFKGDRDIQLNIKIIDTKMKFSRTNISGNVLTPLPKGCYARVGLVKPKGGPPVIRERVKIEDDKVKFLIDSTVCDELDEVGIHKIQIQIYALDDDASPRWTLPSAAELEVCKPDVDFDGVTPIVGLAKAGLSMTISEGDTTIVDFNEDGTYNKTTWSSGDVISTEKLNKIENVLDHNVNKTREHDTQIKDIGNYSLVKHTDGLLYIKKQDGTLIGTGVEVGNDVDLSTLSMTITGQTLTLKDGNTTLSTATIPTAIVTDEQLTAIIQAKIDDGTLTNMTIADNSVTTKKLNIAPKVVNGITNPDFSNGTTGYTLYTATSTSNDDGIEVTPTGENGSIVQRDKIYTEGHIIYGSALVKTSSPNVALFPYNGADFNRVYHSGSGEFERLSVLFSAKKYKFHPGVVNASTDSLPFTFKSFTFIDLTDAFGSGNEPDKSYMDDFVDGFENGAVIEEGLQIIGDTHFRNKRMDKMLPRITKIDDTDENITYYGAWSQDTNNNYNNNSSHYSSDEGSYMEYVFIGTGINVYDMTKHTQGIVEIFIDGVSKGAIDRYISGTSYKSLMYSINNLSFDMHTIKILVTRTKNDKSSNYTFTFDYLEVIDYFPLNNTVEEKDNSTYKVKVLDSLSKIVKDSKLALFKHSSAITIDSANPTIGSTANPLKVNTYQSTKKALLKFDLSGLKEKKIKKAYLRLVCSNYNGNSILDTSFNINAILQPWDNTASWNNYRNSDAWNTAGASGNGTDINSDAVNVGNIYNVEEWTNGFFADITTIVSNWNNDVYENNGILISGNGANFVTESFNGESPCLIVEYTDDLDGISMLTPAKKIQNAMNFLAKGRGTGKFSWQSSGALNAMANAYILFGDEYKHNLSTFFNYYINESGEFVNGATIDNMYKTAFAPALITLYKATNEPKYLSALQSMRTMVDSQPKDSNGIYTISSAITELAYCGLAFLADYGDTFDDQTATDIAIDQCILLYDTLISGQSDKVPLHQVNITVSKGWSRGMGWLFAGIAKVLTSDKIKQHFRYNELVARFVELANTLRRYQRPSGAWCNLIHDSSTFEESSGTILFGTAISIGLNEGILDGSFIKTLSKIIDVICKEHTKTGTDMQNVFMYRNNGYRSPEKNVSDIGWGLFAEMITVIAKNNI